MHLIDYFKSSKYFTVPLYLDSVQIKLMSNYSTHFFFQILFTMILKAKEIRCMITWESRCWADPSRDKPQSFELLLWAWTLLRLHFRTPVTMSFFPQRQKLFATWNSWKIKLSFKLEKNRGQAREWIIFLHSSPRDSWEICNSLFKNCFIYFSFFCCQEIGEDHKLMRNSYAAY